MDMAGEETPINPIALLSEERLKQAVAILQSAQHERPLAQERLKELAQNLVRLLDEIELFGHVVYCGQAAACLLDNSVLRVLAGSIMWEFVWHKPRRRTRISKDVFWHASSPAAEAALNWNSASGPEKWKDRAGCSINAIHKKLAAEAKKANDPSKSGGVV